MLTDPAWLTIALAQEAKDIRESGSPPHPRILDYLATCDDLTPEELATDGTPWCAAFMNWCLAEAGLPTTASSWARDYMGYGVVDPAPARGTIVVWRRIVDGDVDGPYGHVAFLLEDLGDELLVLGGNQDDRVCRMRYPREGQLGDNAYAGIAFRKPA